MKRDPAFQRWLNQHPEASRRAAWDAAREYERRQQLLAAAAVTEETTGERQLFAAEELGRLAARRYEQTDPESPALYGDPW